MPIKAETAVTKKVFTDMWKYSIFRKMSGIIAISIALLFSLFLIVFGFMMKPYLENGFLPDFYTIMGFTLFAVMLLIIFALPQLLYRISVAKLAKKVQYFTFESDSFTVRSEDEGDEGFSKTKYSSVYKIHETGKYFYIYISNMQAFVVCKSQIENASPEQLRQLLQGSIPKNKYKRVGV